MLYEVITLLVRATGRSLASYLEEKIWQPLHMEHDAYWLLDDRNCDVIAAHPGVHCRHIKHGDQILHVAQRILAAHGREYIIGLRVVDTGLIFQRSGNILSFPGRRGNHHYAVERTQDGFFTNVELILAGNPIKAGKTGLVIIDEEKNLPGYIPADFLFLAPLFYWASCCRRQVTRITSYNVCYTKLLRQSLKFPTKHRYMILLII